MATRKSKITTAIVSGVTALALLLGGTFAWQSISQTALNEASDVINPGGRLHDDFDGSNKDVYVENFADEPIFARIQLSEYFAIIANYGKGEAETRNELVGTLSADGTYTYETHLFDTADGAHDYWNWAIGGSTVYMPTFNKNKDSLEADINGTYVDAVGGISNRDGNQYTDYTEYEVDATDTADAIYDADANNIADDGVTYVNETHTAKETLGATLISMDEWMNDYGSQPGEYWVYDTDGWVYWAQAIAPDTATGLLLDSIELSQVMDDTWYYAINVEAQFVTADDVGKSDSTGFYEDAAKAPSANAEALLKAIGVQIDGDSTDDSGNEGDTYQELILDADNTDLVYAAIDEGIQITTEDEAADLSSVYVYYEVYEEASDVPAEVPLTEEQFTYENGILTITDMNLLTTTTQLIVVDANAKVFGTIEIDYSHNVDADYISIGYIPQQDGYDGTKTEYGKSGYLMPGDYIQLTASGTIDGVMDDDIIVSDEDVWTVEGATSASTTINEDGRLTIGDDESTELHLITIKVEYRGLEATECFYVSGGLTYEIAVNGGNPDTFKTGTEYDFDISVTDMNGADTMDKFVGEFTWHIFGIDENGWYVSVSTEDATIDETTGVFSAAKAGKYVVSAGDMYWQYPTLEIVVTE